MLGKLCGVDGLSDYSSRSFHIYPPDAIMNRPEESPRKRLNIDIRFLALLAICTTLAHPTLHGQINGEDAAPGMGLWKSKPDYPIPYGIPESSDIEEKLKRIGDYIDQGCPIRWVDLDTGQAITPGSTDVENPGLEFGLFSLISYEWGVTYAGMLRVAEVTGDPFYKDYVRTRLETIEEIGNHYLARNPEDRPRRYISKRLLEPHSLDHCGAMTAAMIKAKMASIGENFDSFILPSIEYISEEQKRLDDGTLARDRPLPDSLWLDDLYMSIPALAQMGKMSGESKYFDDACKQLIQMTQRMYVPEIGLYRHGWVKSMDPHPTLPWARANGWTIMAATELLSVLPPDHPDFETIRSIYRQHIAGIVRHQGINGFWHQLMDRPETYAETSATAMFVFSIARGINRGWLDAKAYGSAAILGWNAVSSQIDASGAVNGTCVGTGIGWEPAFYAYRPTSPYAAHGYGPVLLAGAEILDLLKIETDKPNFHDGAVHFGETPDWGF